MPDDLRRLLSLILDDIALQSAAMDAGRVTVDEWQRTMALSLLTGHYAAFMDGAGTRTLTDREQARVNEIVGNQLDYLNRFAAELDTREWTATDAARALLYGGAIKGTYYRGMAGHYELEAYPGDGQSECLGNCTCVIFIDEQNQEEMDADVYWRLGSGESCPTCKRRAQQWAPLRFRGGERV